MAKWDTVCQQALLFPQETSLIYLDVEHFLVYQSFCRERTRFTSKLRQRSKTQHMAGSSRWRVVS